MSSLAEAGLVDHVIGIDPDRDYFVAAVVAPGGYRPQEGERFDASSRGYGEAIDWADQYSSPDRRAWAIEGSGSYGAGLRRALRNAGEWVIEFSHPQTASSPGGDKNDLWDAARAAREVLDTDLDKLADPRSGDGVSEAISAIWGIRALQVKQRTALINHLKALIVKAPDALREQLRGLTTTKLVQKCARMRPGTDLLDPTTATKIAIRSAAVAIANYDTQITALTRQLKTQVSTVAPQLLAETGVGPVTAAVTIAAWSHKGRCRDDAAFAKLAGVAPIEATSGQNQNRHRRNPYGDRRLNQALAQIVLTRSRICPETKAFINQRVADGKSKRHARRCLQRYVARQLFRRLENPT